MQKLKLYLGIIFVLLTSVCQAQKNETILNYIETYKEMAINEMQRTGVPASIKLAQGIHETMAGTSWLVRESNNHFGIKCKSTWSGESVKHDDDLKGECFRKYPSAEDSYKDHSDFLRNGQRYSFLFSLDPTDYKSWANGLKKAGYATSPKYAAVIIRLIEDYHLQDYSLIALGKLEKPNPDETIPAGPAPAVTEVAPDPSKPVYPEGEFRINDTKVVYVRKGTSYYSIARHFDVDLAKIFEYNEIPRADITDSDQLVYLQKKNKIGSREFHTVQPGETLHDIAQLEGIKLESLLEMNGLRSGDQPEVGEQLSLKKKTTILPKIFKN
jgi:LysM repeat protein